MSLVRVVIICPASTHTALVSSPSLAVLHLTTYLPAISPTSLAALRRGIQASALTDPPDGDATTLAQGSTMLS